jgi:tripartite-type tricarboxylate transporter receptor subunit TctC
MYRRSLLHTALLAASALALAGLAQAQDFPPKKSVTMVVGFAAGGAADAAARLIAKKLGENIGQSVVVENKGGAGGNIAHGQVANAATDGSVLLFGSVGPLTIAPHVMKLNYDPFKDLAPISGGVNFPNVLVVHRGAGVKTLQEFVALAKKKPASVDYASSGAASASHLAGELFNQRAGVEMVHVPYKGGAPAVVDTVADQTQVLFSAGTQTLPHVKSGKLKLLAVTEAKRSALMPEGVPTVGETLPGYELGVWYGLFGPAHMPKELVDRLNAAANAAMADPAVKARMDSLGVEVVKTTPAQFAAVLKSDAERYGKIIRELGIKGE